MTMLARQALSATMFEALVSDGNTRFTDRNKNVKSLVFRVSGFIGGVCVRTPLSVQSNHMDLFTNRIDSSADHKKRNEKPEITDEKPRILYELTHVLLQIDRYQTGPT